MIFRHFRTLLNTIYFLGYSWFLDTLTFGYFGILFILGYYGFWDTFGYFWIRMPQVEFYCKRRLLQGCRFPKWSYDLYSCSATRATMHQVPFQSCKVDADFRCLLAIGTPSKIVWSRFFCFLFQGVLWVISIFIISASCNILILAHGPPQEYHLELGDLHRLFILTQPPHPEKQKTQKGNAKAPLLHAHARASDARRATHILMGVQWGVEGHGGETDFQRLL